MVLSPLRRLRDKLGAGILDLMFNAAGERDKTLRASELFGTIVLLRIREPWGVAPRQLVAIRKLQHPPSRGKETTSGADT
jgi:hypothetical protein